MKISVIIPTRNEAQVIARTLEHYTALLLLYALEIIISDADSTDGTADIVRDYALRYPGQVILVQKKGKQNIAIGRNAGATVATGDLLFHTDADVRLPHPEAFFETIYMQFAHPEICAATTPIRIYPEEATWNDHFYHFLMNNAIRFSIPLGWCLAKGECQIVRRTAFEAIGGYNELLVAGEDCNLFYRIQQNGKVLFFPDITVHHSPRRFRQYGYWKISYLYLMEGLSRFFTRQSFAREWKVVR